ncbi:Ribonuclease BN [subsurface metagenome]
MDSDDHIKFLGTAGARYVVAKQLRYSAGTFIKIKDKNIILDPGPGTLVRCAKSRPPIDVTTIDAIILSHAHIDHTNDANILIDAMTEGGLKKGGILFAPKDCLFGINAVILNYLRDFLEDIKILEENKKYQIGDLTFNTSIKHRHPVETFGIIFNFNGKKISFLVDTNYFPELIESYKNSYILILNVVRYKPHKSSKVMHLSIHDAKEIISKIRPEKTILTHFGWSMIRAKPWEVAERLTSELGVEVIAASDGMSLEF